MTTGLSLYKGNYISRTTLLFLRQTASRLSPRHHHPQSPLRLSPPPGRRHYENYLTTTTPANMPLSKDKLLVHLPIDPPAAWLQKVSQRFPGLEVRCEKARVVATGLSSADELAPDVLDGVTIMCLYPPLSPDNMSRVRYVQLASAGSDRWVGHPKYEDEEVRFCSSSGVHAYVPATPCLLVSSRGVSERWDVW